LINLTNQDAGLEKQVNGHLLKWSVYVTGYPAITPLLGNPCVPCAGFGILVDVAGGADGLRGSKARKRFHARATDS
jgi:hypothetical protein